MESKYIHRDSCPRDLAYGWFNRGKKEVNKEEQYLFNVTNEASKDLFRFVSYWISFNQLYNYMVDDIEDSSEIDRIKDYCDRHMKSLIKLIDFDADCIAIFKERPIISWVGIPAQYAWNDSNAKERIANSLYRDCKNKRINKLKTKCLFAAEDYINICDNSKPIEDRIKSLLITIYKVRCNLFHGMKSPDPGRDYDLVNNAADLLENLLPDLIEETFRY